MIFRPGGLPNRRTFSAFIRVYPRPDKQKAMQPILSNLIKKYPDLAACLPEVECTFDLLRQTYRHGGKVLVCGNGGSAADSEHIVSELMKGFNFRRTVPASLRKKLIAAFPDQGEYLADHLQGALPTISLVSQVSLISAFANDIAADMAFAQQVYGYGLPGDVLIGISTSGSSRNVLHALRVARTLGLKTVGLTGRQGGDMPRLCDAAICVPRETTSDIQERHIAIYHTLCAMLETEFFSS